ncbi:TPA: glycosyltransferase [Vibrio vulnificus]|nr:glycosyltransferase family 4 protein [Vibrio vulnificus]HAS6291294.1 glycosyltransferase [Vibrio vulnificus]HAS6315737.1 glycosyltransferase [Vibrio vulnificus]HDY7558311.1 glycosyltransferase family 4 protein [Vibrio vulnificus]HDY7572499.1 glycosyltransferase family 4 protein [Vibrio vulnificus]
MSIYNNLKVKIKKSSFFLKIYESLFQRDLVNIFSSNLDRKVLFSYSTYHFRNGNYVKHSNYSESLVIAKIFHSLGYKVDVVNNNRLTKLDLSSYDVIFGEGLPLYQALECETQAIKIYYGTGSHPFHCTQQSISRLIDFYRKKTFLATGSLRTNDYRWGIAASLADSVICIGNEVTKKTFKEQGALSVYTLDPSFHARDDALTIGQLKDFNVCRRSVLWFGSYGLLHKGLDLAVEAFRENPSWTLHICGYTDAEKDLLDAIHLPENVVVHGFVNVFSEDFKRLCNDCGFVLLPSCSEGIATAVITAVANGAMIPLVTDESGFDTNGNGFKIELNAESIAKVLSMINELSSDTLKQMSLDVQIKTLRRYTIENYKNNMRRSLKEILSHE